MESKFWFYPAQRHSQTRSEGAIEIIYRFDNQSIPVLNFVEHLIAPNNTMKVKSNTHNLYIPIEGELALSGGKTIYPGVIVQHTTENPSEIRNHQENWARLYTLEMATKMENLISSYSLEGNSLNLLLKNEIFELNLARFSNRVEDIYKTSFNHTHVIMIHGTLEFEDRLLQSRDQLYNENQHHFEFESHDENCIFFILSY